MPVPYIVKARPKTTPISANGLNSNFAYLEKYAKSGIDIPPPPNDSEVVYVLSAQGGHLFWMPTEEC